RRRGGGAGAGALHQFRRRAAAVRQSRLVVAGVPAALVLAGADLDPGAPRRPARRSRAVCAPRRSQPGGRGRLRGGAGAGGPAVNRIARHGGRIAAVVLVLGLLRLFVLVLHAPLAGYANQYDMARSSDCLGLWPDLPAEQQALATPAAPRTDYRYGGATGAACYPSTAVLAARLALELDAAVEELRGEVVRDFDLRQLGALYALVGALIALALHRGLAAHPG